MKLDRRLFLALCPALAVGTTAYFDIGGARRRAFRPQPNPWSEIRMHGEWWMEQAVLLTPLTPLEPLPKEELWVGDPVVPYQLPHEG
jgi:hypothetical protein